MNWQEGLKIGVLEIDVQHRLLFEKFDTFFTAYLEGKSDANDLYRLFWFVEAYVVSHFQDEERLMQEVAFPGYAKHHQQHLQFTATIVKMKERLTAEGPTPDVMKTIAATVKNWLTHHISCEDTAIGRFINQG